MVEQVKAAWEAWTIGKKIAAGLGIPVVGILLGLTQLTDHEKRIASLEESRNFVNCWLLESAEGRDPNPCRYLLANPEAFRPPFTGAP